MLVELRRLRISNKPTRPDKTNCYVVPKVNTYSLQPHKPSFKNLLPCDESFLPNLNEVFLDVRSIHLLPGLYLDVDKTNRYRMHKTTHLLWGIILGCGQDQPIQNARDNSFAVGDYTWMWTRQLQDNPQDNPHKTTHLLWGIGVVLWGRTIKILKFLKSQFFETHATLQDNSNPPQ